MLVETGAGTRKDPKMPFVLKAFAGTLNCEEIKLFNLMLVDWQLQLKKEKFKVGECPWYQPSSQRKDYFTFWGILQREYGFQTTADNFKNFDGSVWKVIGMEIRKREETWVSEMDILVQMFVCTYQCCVCSLTFLK